MQFAGGWQLSTPYKDHTHTHTKNKYTPYTIHHTHTKDKFQVLPARMEPVAEQNTISQALLPCFGKI